MHKYLIDCGIIDMVNQSLNMFFVYQGKALKEL